MSDLALFGDEMVTTKELAEQMNTSPKVILENARKCLPNKRIENGKPTYWTKNEVTILLDWVKTHDGNHSSDLYFQSKSQLSTDLTPALKIKKAMELMQEGYEEEIAILKAKNAEKQAVIDRIEKAGGCFSIAQTAKALKLPYGRNTLFNRLKAMKFLSKSNEPYQAFVSPGYFKVISKVCSDNQNHIVPLVTGKGLVYLAKKFNTEIDPAVMPDAE